MNSRFVWVESRLALGLEPIDGLRDSRVSSPLVVVPDDPKITREERERLRGLRADLTDLIDMRRPSMFASENRRDNARPRISSWDRHPSARHVLRYESDLYRDGDPAVTVRVLDGPYRQSPRKIVPRRFRIPLQAPTPDPVPPGLTYDDRRNARVRRPRFFPGAGYDLPDAATAIRGRAYRGDQPVRWCRVEARRVAGLTAAVVGRAHGDEKGEFILVLGPGAAPAGTGATSLTVFLTVHASPAPASPADEDEALQRAIDPFWDVPIERLDSSNDTDGITRGETVPASYTHTAGPRAITLRFGRIHNERLRFEPT